MMSWDEILQKARQWSGTSCLGFSVTKSDAESRKITFTAPSASFYLTVPERVGAEEWGVWSEDDACIAKLSVAMEMLTSAGLSVENVLTRVEGCLGEGGEGGDSGEGSEEDDFDDYYGDEDFDAEAEPKAKNPESPEVSADAFFTGQGSSAAVHRLLSDLKALNKSAGKYGITGQPRGDNLFVWDVELSDFEKGSLLEKDLQHYASQHQCRPVVEVEMKFPKDYPMSPPFVRIIRPRFQFLTGHVTIGGSICMQMLTRSGWSPSNDIESILVQVRAEIMSDPRARLERGGRQEYSESEAKTAFERMVAKYGWNR